LIATCNLVDSASTTSISRSSPPPFSRAMLSSQPFAAGFLLALLAQCGLESADAFALSSSQSPKRKQITNQGKAAEGFAKRTDSVRITHTADTSPSTQNLLNFLLQWKSEGLGAQDSGTEVGFDTTNNIRGLYATKSFKKGEIICKIPSDVALALTDPSTASGEQESVVDGGVNFLEWYLNKAEARGMWSAYLDTLPTRDAYFDVRCVFGCIRLPIRRKVNSIADNLVMKF
jgi:hypothetical protein